MLVSCVHPCVIEVRDNVIRNAPLCPQRSGIRYILRLGHILCYVCMSRLLCSGSSEAVRDVPGLHVVGDLSVCVLRDVGVSQAVSCVSRCQGLLGCMLCVCEC